MYMLEKKTHQVWLGQPVVALGALEAWQWGLTLEVVAVEGLQPRLQQLAREQLWQQQLRKQK